MKFKRIFSAAAAALVAASAIVTPASANWEKNIEGADKGLNAAAGLYMIVLYNKDEFNSDGTPLVDRGIDLSKIGYVSYTMEVNPEDRAEAGGWFDGQFGGGVGASIHAWDKIPGTPSKPTKPREERYDDPAEYQAAMELYEKQSELREKRKAAAEAYAAQGGGTETKTTPSGGESTLWNYYNWDCSYQYWGVIDPDAQDPMALDIDGEYMAGEPTYIGLLSGDDSTAFLETLAPYTYRIKTPVANPIADGVCTADDIDTWRMYIQSWGDSSSLFTLTITRTVIYDRDGKAFMAFDKQGKEVPVNDDDNKEPVQPELTSVFRPTVDASITDTDVRNVLKNVMVHDPSYMIAEDAGMTISDAEKTADTLSFDISFSSQPDGNVTVKVPAPEFLGNDIYVYHYDADGNPTLLDSEIKHGYVVFETDSFSKFALTKTKIESAGAAPAESAASNGTSDTPNSTAATSSSSESKSGLPMPALIGIIAGVVVVIAVVVIIVVKKKKA